jgi:hypothetical protein
VSARDGGYIVFRPIGQPVRLGKLTVYVDRYAMGTFPSPAFAAPREFLVVQNPHFSVPRVFTPEYRQSDG